MSWRSPKTAPRDGTLIIGLFERRGKRAVAFEASFDVDGYRLLLTDPAPDRAPQWIKDLDAKHLEQFHTDPSFGFRPLSDSDKAIDVGRMIGWRPAASQKGASE